MWITLADEKKNDELMEEMKKLEKKVKSLSLAYLSTRTKIL